MLRLEKKYSIFLLFLIGLTSSLFSQGLPVVPYPQIVKEGTSILLLQNLRVAPINLRGEMEGLKQLWGSYFSNTSDKSQQTEQKITMSILGDNADFDRQLFKNVSEKEIEKIGIEGYILVLKKKQLMLAAQSEKGLFYGLQTLRQLRASSWNKEVTIIDWPDFPNRIIMDDISRGPVPTFVYIKNQIDRLSALKINYLTFYVEQVIQSPSYPDFSPADGKLTLSQIRELSDYAAQNYMQLIGSFQSFGHFEKILSYPQYRDMGATSTMLSPINPKTKLFLKTIIEEYCDAFNGPFFNVNCDETWDLGRGSTKAYADSIGISRFYADHINFLHGILEKKQKRMMLWGDIALQHEEILDMIPKDIMFLSWEYGSQESYDPWMKPFSNRKLDFMVCPGILNANRMFPDLTMARANIEAFSKAGFSSGAKGVFTTVWDDGGTHLFSNDWSGVGFAAEKSWHVGANANFDERYEQVSFGSQAIYFPALQQLLQLRENPITYGMNDAIWRQQLLPEQGHTAVIETSGIKEALESLKKARSILESSFADKNQSDIEALRLVVDQYSLLLNSKLSVIEIADDYRKACTIQHTNPITARELLISCVTKIEEMSSYFSLLGNRFRYAWLLENQVYGLDLALDLYSQKEKTLHQLGQIIFEQVEHLDQGIALAPPLQIGLDIQENDKMYFKNWLLLGSIPLDTLEKLPEFTYHPEHSKNVPPEVGSSLSYQGQEYQWKKYKATDGAVIDLRNQFTPNEKAVVYAFCSIAFNEPENIKAFIGSNDGIEVFINEELVYALNQRHPFILDETEIKLPFKKGTNSILLKISQWKGNWKFSFRLAHKALRSHQHHYFTLKN